MKAKHLCTFFIVCLIIIFSQHGIISAASDTMLNEIKLYGNGAKDTKDTAAAKISAKGFQCGSGKATFLEFKDIQRQSISQKITEKIEKIIALDEDLKKYGEGLSIKDMPINLIVCGVLENSPFAFTTYYFSEFDQKILAIMIEIENNELVIDKLAMKFGSCILKGYCESEKSILFLVNISGLRLQVYFYENLKSHYDNIKKKNAMNDKKMEEKLNEAF